MIEDVVKELENENDELREALRVCARRVEMTMVKVAGNSDAFYLLRDTREYINKELDKVDNSETNS